MLQQTSRRGFLRTALAVTAGTAAVPVAAIATASVASAADEGASPYGGLSAADSNGIRLPAGFSARVVARSGQTVGQTGFSWRQAPDGMATFDDGNGGWYLAVNHEIASGGGGVSSLRFNGSGNVTSAYSILQGTRRNCAGGPTPWGTWLSCEEVDTGWVYECDPTDGGNGVRRAALGSFNHEAVAVDPVRNKLYLTEDKGTGLLYRFTPQGGPRADGSLNLDSGILEAAYFTSGSSIAWTPVPDPSAANTPTRDQNYSGAGANGIARFNGGEGIWYYDDKVWFCTKGDDSVWELDLIANTIVRIWDGNRNDPSRDGLYDVDTITVENGSGDLFVAEDGGQLRLVLITPEGTVSPFLQLVGHGGSEIAGPVFNPAGDKLYFNSQRGTDNTNGITYEVSGPFRGLDVAPPPGGAPSGLVTLQNVGQQRFLVESDETPGLVETGSIARDDSIWNLIALGDGSYNIQNQLFNGYLDADAVGDPIDTSEAPTADDIWRLVPVAGQADTYLIQNTLTSGNIEAIAGATAILSTSTGAAAQWVVESTGVTPPPPPPPPVGGVLEGVATLRNVAQNRFLVETTAGVVDTGSTAGADAPWVITSASGEFVYTIQNQALSGYLDADNIGDAIDTSIAPEADDQWEFIAVDGAANTYLVRNPLTGGYLQAVDGNTAVLSSTTGAASQWVLDYIDGPQPPVEGDVLVRINAGGPQLAAVDGGPAWQADTVAAPHPFLSAPGDNRATTFAALSGSGLALPDAGLDRQRFSLSQFFAYTIPADPGSTVQVRIYSGNGWSGTQQPGQRVFDVLINGEVVENDLDLSARLGHQVGGVFAYDVDVPANGNVRVLFRNSIQAAIISGLEVVELSPAPPQPPSGEEVLVRINAGGPQIAAADAGPAWEADTTASPHPLLVSRGSNSATSFAGITAPNGADVIGLPDSALDVQRFSRTGGFAYRIPAAAGSVVKVRVISGNGWSGTALPGQRQFDVKVNGQLVANNLDLSARLGHQVGGSFEYDAVSTDGFIRVEFVNQPEEGSVRGQAVLSGLEVVKTGTVPVPQSDIVVRINSGGERLAALDGGPDWEEDSQANKHPFVFDIGDNRVSNFPNLTPGVGVPSSLPARGWALQRHTPGGFGYQVPLPAGTPARVRVFTGNGWSGSSEPGQRIFDIRIDGVVVENDLDLSAQLGHEVGGVFEYDVVSDGRIHISFRDNIQRAVVSAVEVIRLDSVDPSGLIGAGVGGGASGLGPSRRWNGLVAHSIQNGAQTPTDTFAAVGSASVETAAAIVPDTTSIDGEVVNLSATGIVVASAAASALALRRRREAEVSEDRGPGQS